MNPLDTAALKHDIAYAGNRNRRMADQELMDFAFARLSDTDADGEERAAVTACCLVSKITLEKFCAGVKKVFGRKRKRTGKIGKNAVSSAQKERKARKKIK